MTNNNPSHKKLANPCGGPKYTKPAKGPTRPDKAMESALAANRVALASKGLDPDNLPWYSIDTPEGHILRSRTNGKRLGRFSPSEASPASYFDRWHHKRTGE